MYTCSAPAYLCHDKGLLKHAFSSHSFVDLLVCLGTMACCKEQALAWNLIFDARILWNTETFMVDSITVQVIGAAGSVSAQQA